MALRLGPSLLPVSNPLPQGSQLTVWAETKTIKLRPAVVPLPVDNRVQTPFVPPSAKAPSPQEPLQDDFQEEMMYYFDLQGYWGLASTMYRRAREESSHHSNRSYWRVLVEDQEQKTYHLYKLLLSLPGTVIRSLIRNTLTHDIVHDPAVKKFVEHHMYLRERPGIYMQVTAHGSKGVTVLGPKAQAPANTGKWMTGGQIQEMLDFLELYLRGGSASDVDAKRFDRKLSTDIKEIKDLIEDKKRRRYAKNPKQVARLQAWAKVIEKQYVTNLSNGDTDASFMRCPTEVGWSISVKNRCSYHLANTYSTYIFGFAHVFTQFSLEFTEQFPQAHQFTVFPIFEKDADLCKVGEFAATLLTSSLSVNGGLNCTLPGKVSFHSRTISRSSPKWGRNAVEMFNRAHVDVAMMEDLRLMEEYHAFVTPIGSNRVHRRKRVEEARQFRGKAVDLRHKITDLESQGKTLAGDFNKLQDKLLQKLDKQGDTDSSTTSGLVLRLRRHTVSLMQQIRAKRMGQEAAISDIFEGKSTSSPDIQDPEVKIAYNASACSIQRRIEESVQAYKVNRDVQDQALRRQQPKEQKVLKDFWDGFHRLKEHTPSGSGTGLPEGVDEPDAEGMEDFDETESLEEFDCSSDSFTDEDNDALEEELAEGSNEAESDSDADVGSVVGSVEL